MGTFKVKLKYYIYGLVLGTVFAAFCQTICIECSLIDLNSFLSGTIIDMVFFVAFFAVRFLYIRRSQWKKISNWVYFQQPTYCFIFLTGFLIAVGFYKGILASYMPAIGSSEWKDIFQYVSLAILGGLAVIFATVQKNVLDSTGEKNEADYLMDREINNFKDDQFFEGQIDRFITEISNYKKACVFGIEGPWGVGKTSFVNLICKRLSEDRQNKIVIYKFDPLNYEDSSRVLRNFYTGLIAKIREEHFEPELEALLSSYMDKVVATVSEQNFYGIKVKFSNFDTSEERIIEKLEKALECCKYRILVVIDDLDRLDFLTIKKILFLMRHIFCFDKLQFIVCYDIENIIWSAQINLNSNNLDKEKIIEFMDKYVSDEYHLHLKKDAVKKYLSQLSNSIMATERVRISFWKDMIHGIEYILNSDEDENYQHFFSTPRRIKKILRQIARLSNKDWFKTNLYDFNNLDLLNLLLLYMYYPIQFHKLWTAETDGRRGKYSYTMDETVEQHLKRLQNSFDKMPYLAAFLFRQLFADKLILNNSRDEIYRRAAFNIPIYSSSGVLENDLRFIIFGEISSEYESHSLYKNIVMNELLLASSIEDVQHMFKKHQKHIIHLWDFIIGYEDNFMKHEQLNIPTIKYLIVAAIGQLSSYKLTLKIVSFHTKILIYIRFLLNDLAKRQDKQLIKFIFDSESEGVLFRLLSREPQSLALFYLFDALYLKGVIDIRTERNDIFPLNNVLICAAVGHLSNSMNIDEMAKIELRTISQSIYHFFKTAFGNRNLWNEFSDLPLDDIFEFNSELPREEQVIEQQRALFSLKLFILYQIGNLERGLAGYDLVGSEDNFGIRADFSQYLINQCFNIDLYHDSACFDFIEFMLISTSDVWIIRKFGNNQQNDSSLFTISPETLISLIDPNVLKNYWLQNREAIINNVIFDGRQFYVNQDTVLDARYVVDVIRYSLDDWTSGEQASQ